MKKSPSPFRSYRLGRFYLLDTREWLFPPRRGFTFRIGQGVYQPLLRVGPYLLCKYLREI
jgi:hypothetical protein